jgi:hypothetical protein
LPAAANVRGGSLKKIFDNKRHSIYQNLMALPRAFIVFRAKVLPGRDEIFKEMLRPEFDFADCAIVEEKIEELSGQLDEGQPRRQEVKFLHYTPNEIRVKVSLSQRGLLVLADIYYPGWQAYIDGMRTKVYPANYIMRAVTVPEGTHIVEFYYRPLSFRIGAVLSLTTVIFLLALLFRSRSGYKRRT